jgi:hypothetical protein
MMTKHMHYYPEDEQERRRAYQRAYQRKKREAQAQARKAPKPTPQQSPAVQVDFAKQEAQQQRLIRLSNKHQISMAEYQELLERDKQEQAGGWYDSNAEFFARLKGE